MFTALYLAGRLDNFDFVGGVSKAFCIRAFAEPTSQYSQMFKIKQSVSASYTVKIRALLFHGVEVERKFYRCILTWAQ
jgi:hypothetical protein